MTERSALGYGATLPLCYSVTLPLLVDSTSFFDAKAVQAGADLVARMDARVLRRQGVEKRAVAAAEVADVDHAVRVGHHFEMFAGEVLVGHADVAFAAHGETEGRDFVLLAGERAFEADQPLPF